MNTPQLFSGNKIDVGKAKVIGEALKANTSLTELNLCCQAQQQNDEFKTC